MGHMFYVIASTIKWSCVLLCICVVEMVRICSRLFIPFGCLESNCFSLVVVFFVLFCFFKAGSICLCLPDLILVLFSVFVSSLLKAVLIFRLGDFLIFRKMLLNFFFLHQLNSNVFGFILFYGLHFLWEEHFQERFAVCLSFELKQEELQEFFTDFFFTLLVTYCTAVHRSEPVMESGHVIQKDVYGPGCQQVRQVGDAQLPQTRHS